MANKFLVKSPLITEKATALSAFNTYSFVVDNSATSSEIKKVIQEVYKVKVSRVNIINVKPKERRIGRHIGMKPGYKKALVTLKKGEKMDIANS